MSPNDSWLPVESADVGALSRSPPMPILPTTSTLSGALATAGAPRPLDASYGDECGGDSDVAVGSSTDARIVRELERLSEADDDYWAFRGRAARQQTQGLTQYPAMMVPAMQAVLVKALVDVDGCVSRVIDPFTGSGTTMVECMRLGLDYTGQDINPLAVLFCRTKAGPFHTRKLASVIKEVLKQAGADRDTRTEADFPGLKKWFCPSAITELSRIRRAIRQVDHTWCRRVLWTGLAETVRLTSNSRTSTFKLHIRSTDNLDSRTVNPLRTFTTVVTDINERLHAEAEILRERGHLATNGYYRGKITVRLGDSTKLKPARDLHDLLVTSPPYGDNTSTVPYGQYSYLPLQWIDLDDIDDDADSRCLRTTHEIDARSLGGSKKNAVEDVAHLMGLSPSLKQTLRRLKKMPADRGARVAAFIRDLDGSLCTVLKALRPRAYMIWTVGNRRVGGDLVPTDRILEELMAARDAHLVSRLERKIPNKRMATRNSIAATMRGEAILVFRKA